MSEREDRRTTDSLVAWTPPDSLDTEYSPDRMTQASADESAMRWSWDTSSTEVQR